MAATFAALTWYQARAIDERGYWVFFRQGVIPVPAITLTSLGTLVGLVLFLSAFFSKDSTKR